MNLENRILDMVSFSELLSKAGTATGDFLVDAGNAIAENYCGLYRDYPHFIVGSSIDPVQPFRRALADSLCNGRQPGLPNPPAPPFSGGQCECVRYVVNVLVEFYEEGNFIQSINPSPILFGKIGATRVIPSTNEGNAILQVSCQGSVECGEQEWFNLVESGLFLPPYNYRIASFNVTRFDAGVDNCGDPDPDFPLAVPPPSSLKPPVSYTPPSGAPNINIPVVFVPVTNNLNIPVSLDLDVDFNFNFNPEGLNFDFGNGGSGDGFTPADRDALTQAGNNAANAANNAGAAKNAAEGAGDAANAAKDAANAAKDAAERADKNTAPPPKPDSDDLDKTDKSPDDNNRDNVEDLVWVKINLTQLPFDNKQQFGEGAPNVYYAGWFEWKASGVPLPRQPINFSSSLFLAPKGVNGYAYTLTSGAEGYASEYTTKNEE